MLKSRTRWVTPALILALVLLLSSTASVLADDWLPTEVVSTESAANSRQPSIFADSDGNVHLVWEDKADYLDAGTDRDIFYKRFDAASSAWTSAEVISTDSSGRSDDPSIAVGSSGNIHVAWSDESDILDAGTDFDIFYKRFDHQASAWMPTEVISEGMGYSAGSHTPDLSLDHDGNVHVVWVDWSSYLDSGVGGDIYYRQRDSTSSWGAIELVSSESTEGSEFDPSLGIDAEGNVHVAWVDRTDYMGAGSDRDVWYKKRDSLTGAWSVAEVVSTESDGWSWMPTLSVDSEGNIHVAWSDDADYMGAGSDEDIFYKRFDVTTSSWTATEVMTPGSTAPYCQNTDSFVDPLDNLHLVWYCSDGEKGIKYRRWDAYAQSWTETQMIATESTDHTTEASVAVDSSLFVHVAWADWTDYSGSGTDTDIFYKRTGTAIPEFTHISTLILVISTAIIFILVRKRG